MIEPQEWVGTDFAYSVWNNYAAQGDASAEGFMAYRLQSFGQHETFKIGAAPEGIRINLSDSLTNGIRTTYALGCHKHASAVLGIEHPVEVFPAADGLSHRHIQYQLFEFVV